MIYNKKNYIFGLSPVPAKAPKTIVFPVRRVTTTPCATLMGTLQPPEEGAGCREANAVMRGLELSGPPPTSEAGRETGDGVQSPCLCAEASIEPKGQVQRAGEHLQVLESQVCTQGGHGSSTPPPSTLPHASFPSGSS